MIKFYNVFVIFTLKNVPHNFNILIKYLILHLNPWFDPNVWTFAQITSITKTDCILQTATPTLEYQRTLTSCWWINESFGFKRNGYMKSTLLPSHGRNGVSYEFRNYSCFYVHCETLNSKQYKEYECIMEFPLIHSNVLIKGPLGYVTFVTGVNEPTIVNIEKSKPEKTLWWRSVIIDLSNLWRITEQTSDKIKVAGFVFFVSSPSQLPRQQLWFILTRKAALLGKWAQ